MKKKPEKPKRIPPLGYPTKEDYARMAALRMCGGCSGRGAQRVILPSGETTFTRCPECNGCGTIER